MWCIHGICIFHSGLAAHFVTSSQCADNLVKIRRSGGLESNGMCNHWYVANFVVCYCWICFWLLIFTEILNIFIKILTIQTKTIQQQVVFLWKLSIFIRSNHWMHWVRCLTDHWRCCSAVFLFLHLCRAQMACCSHLFVT